MQPSPSLKIVAIDEVYIVWTKAHQQISNEKYPIF